MERLSCLLALALTLAAFSALAQAPGSATPAVRVSTLAGSGLPGSADGVGTTAQFSFPAAIALDDCGNAYVTEDTLHQVRRIVVATGVVSTLAGGNQAGFVDSIGGAARFHHPTGLAADGNGNVYVADSKNHRIRKLVVATGAVSTLAGSGIPGFADGQGLAAQFDSPWAVALDGRGSLYIADCFNHRIRKMELATGVVSTLAGSGAPGFANATGLAARFNRPYGMAVDGKGGLLVVDQGNYRIRKIIIATGVVSTLAGSGTYGFSDGPGSLARFRNLTDIAIDGNGTVYVVDRVNGRIRVIRQTAP